MKLSMSGLALAGVGTVSDGSGVSIPIDALMDPYVTAGPCGYVGACQGSQVMDPCSGICHEPNAGDYGDLEKAYQGVLNQLGIGSGAGAGSVIGGPSVTTSIPTWVWALAGGAVLLSMMKR